MYFYNDKWQVLTETDANETMKAWYAYGNYIDEVLLTAPINFAVLTRCYVHDHLYSPAALTTGSGTVLERYEYDAYGNPYVLEPNFADDPDGKTDWANPYYFQGKRLDVLDGNSLELMSWPYRDYSTYLGRWYGVDKFGMIPGGGNELNPFSVTDQYIDGLGLYEFALSNPLINIDRYGLACKTGGFAIISWMATPEGKTPVDILKTKSVVNKFFLITLVASGAGSGPIGLAYSLAAGSGWSVIASAADAKMKYRGGHLYALECEWLCIPKKKRWIKPKIVKEPVFAGCFWWKCEADTCLGKDMFRYPIHARDRRECAGEIIDHHWSFGRRFHCPTTSDMKKIKKAVKKGWVPVI